MIHPEIESQMHDENKEAESETKFRRIDCPALFHDIKYLPPIA
jgi:hypothetical protein